MPKPRTVAALKVAGAGLMSAFTAVLSWQAGGFWGLLTGVSAVGWAMMAREMLDAKDASVRSTLESIGRNTILDLVKVRQTRRFTGDGPSVRTWRTYTDTDGAKWRVTVEVVDERVEA